MRVLSVLYISGLLAMTGCATDHYEYPLYQPQSLSYGRVFPVRVAIAYPEEGRSAPDRDEDLEPIVTSRCIELPTYISPRLEMSRGLLEELRATQAFQTLHWAPDSVDDYDLVIRMKLISGGKRFQSDTCPVMLGPSQWELLIADQRGNELYRQELVLARTKIYAKSLVAEFRKDEGIFLGEAVRQILLAAERAYGNLSDIKDNHALAYIEKRAPELKGMRERIAANSADSRLSRAYLLRIGVIEAERMTEEKTTEALQGIYDQAWIEVQEHFSRQLKELGENVAQIPPQNLNLLLSCANSAQERGLGEAKPPEIVYTAARVRNDMIELLGSAEGAHKLYGTLSKSLLPGNLPALTVDEGFDAELRRQLRVALEISQPAAPGAAAQDAVGCAKDTECKGKRICVKGRCVAP